MEGYDVLKDILVEKSGLPKWVISVLLEVFALPLVAFLAFGKLLEGFELEPPAAQLIPACLTLGLYWLVLVHYLSSKPLWLLAAVAGLLGIVCVATFKLWIVYHTDPSHEPIPLSIPFVVVAVACFIMVLVGNDLLSHYATGIAISRSIWVAVSLGVALSAGLLAVAIFDPEQWYFIEDTIFANGIPGARIGVLLAPYSRDPHDDARARMEGDLNDLLADDPVLARKVSLQPLPRPIPGDNKDPAQRDVEQREVAQRIAAYDRARMVVYGDVEGKYQGYLVRTNLALVRPTQFLEGALSIAQLTERPLTNDAAAAHYFAAIVASATSFFAGQCATAERLANEAAKALREIPGDPEDHAKIPGPAATDLMRANSIGCEVMEQAASPEQVSEAIDLLDRIISNPATTTDMRLQAASAKGLIERNVAISQTEITGKRAQLQAAVDTYSAALKDAAPDADPFYLAGIWNGLGVAREKLEGVTNRGDKPARLAALTGAFAAYDAADKLIDAGASAKTRASHADWIYLGFVVRSNRANAVFRQGLVEDDPDLIARAIQIDQGLLPALDDEYWIHDDLAGAYLFLSQQRDTVANLRHAQQQLLRGLATLPAESGSALVLDLVLGLGTTDLDLAHAGAEPQLEAQGIAALGCVLRLYRGAGRDTKDIEARLDAEKQRVGAAAFATALRSEPDASGRCQASAGAD
jgi:tetratricopeptide (TPR) repeat protein